MIGQRTSLGSSWVTNCLRNPSQGLWWSFPRERSVPSFPGKQFLNECVQTCRSPEEGSAGEMESWPRKEDGSGGEGSR